MEQLYLKNMEHVAVKTKNENCFAVSKNVYTPVRFWCILTLCLFQPGIK